MEVEFDASPRNLGKIRREEQKCAKDIPDSVARRQSYADLCALNADTLSRAYAVLQRAASFGVRREDTIKADLERWHREASRKSTVDMQEGTKAEGRHSAQSPSASFSVPFWPMHAQCVPKEAEIYWHSRNAMRI